MRMRQRSFFLQIFQKQNKTDKTLNYFRLQDKEKFLCFEQNSLQKQFLKFQFHQLYYRLAVCDAISVSAVYWVPDLFLCKFFVVWYYGSYYMMTVWLFFEHWLKLVAELQFYQVCQPIKQHEIHVQSIPIIEMLVQ